MESGLRDSWNIPLPPFPLFDSKAFFLPFLQAWTVRFITVSGWSAGSSGALPREEVRGVLPLPSFLVPEFIWHPAAQLHFQYPPQMTLLVALEVGRVLEETLPAGLPEGPPIHSWKCFRLPVPGEFSKPERIRKKFPYRFIKQKKILMMIWPILAPSRVKLKQ